MATYELGGLVNGSRALIRDDGKTVARVDSDEGPALVGELTREEAIERFGLDDDFDDADDDD
jgi:hypothetical protein